MFKKCMFLFVTVILICLSCDKPFGLKPISPIHNTVSQANFENYDFKNWHYKDMELDSLPGISLNKAKDIVFPLLGESNEIIIAILDSDVDIKHKALKANIWINQDEIPNNGVDDDNNGYIDDINGWNFLGNDVDDYIIYSSLECVRIIQRYSSEFQDKTLDEIEVSDRKAYALYIKAKNYYDEIVEQKKAEKEYADFLYYGYPKSKKTVESFFESEPYTVEMLDSLYEKIKDSKPDIASDVYYMSDFIKYELTEKMISEYKADVYSSFNKSYNLNYYDKLLFDKNPLDITATNYGNNLVNKNLDVFYHGTQMAGLAGFSKEIDEGIIKNIKIMPLVISSNGSEHDKDIALAIKYAVDNGAKVINMSFGKTFSLNKEWVFDAFQYANERDVIIISSAGNSNLDLNKNNDYYPNDNINNSQEISDNFLLVASSSFKANDSLASFFTNFGNIDVDLFAPGEKIQTCVPNNAYKTDDGTSLSAAITSGVAALVRSYYPDLTASQVKHILMDSGVEYTFDVKVGDTLVPFNTLSKSGKILNAYNALIMADRISRKD